MNTIDVEKFIEVMKKYPVLYDRRHEFYNNFAKKTQVWRLVGKEMGVSGEVLRIKWKGLKDGYRKYKRYQTGVAPANKSWRGWCWGENLRFLDDFEIRPKYFKPQRSINSSSPTHQSPSLGVEGIYLQDNLDPGQWTVSPAIQYGYKLGCRNLSDTDDEFGAKRVKLDSIDHLFNSYADIFRKFSLKTQCVLKMQMAKIFADAELAELTNVSEVPGNADTQKEQASWDIKLEESPLLVESVVIKIERTDDNFSPNDI